MNETGWSFNTFKKEGSCAKTGMLGIGLTSSPLAVTSRCPFIKTNVGAVSSQAFPHPGLGPLALHLLEIGYSPEKVIAELRASDRWCAYRQFGIVDNNGVSAAFTGSDNKDWKGHRNGPNYVAMGNHLTGPAVVEAIEAAWLASEDEILEERLLRALEAGKAAGGEKGGHLSAGLIVHGRRSFPRTDLRVDRHFGSPGTDAVNGLRALFDEYRPLIPYYEQRPDNPLIGTWREWLEAHTSERTR